MKAESAPARTTGDRPAELACNLNIEIFFFFWNKLRSFCYSELPGVKSGSGSIFGETLPCTSSMKSGPAGVYWPSDWWTFGGISPGKRISTCVVVVYEAGPRIPKARSVRLRRDRRPVFYSLPVSRSAMAVSASPSSLSIGCPNWKSNSVAASRSPALVRWPVSDLNRRFPLSIRCSSATGATSPPLSLSVICFCAYFICVSCIHRPCFFFFSQVRFAPELHVRCFQFIYLS